MDHFSPSLFAILNAIDVERHLKHTLPMDYGKIFRTLHSYNVEYLVVGGVALNLHGIPRMTADLDLFVDLKKDNLKRFIDSTDELDCRPRLPVEKKDLLDEVTRGTWISEKNLVAFTFYNPDDPTLEMDIILSAPDGFRDVFERRTEVKYGELKIPVLSLDDMIRWKAQSERLQDQADVKALRKVRELKDRS